MSWKLLTNSDIDSLRSHVVSTSSVIEGHPGITLAFSGEGSTAHVLPLELLHISAIVASCKGHDFGLKLACAEHLYCRRLGPIGDDQKQS